MQLPEVVASLVFRLGLIVYRMTMILTVLRRYEAQTLAATMSCEDSDFGMAMDMAAVLLEHALLMPQTMFKANAIEGTSRSKQRQFYDLLPATFSRAQADTAATILTLKTRTVTSYLERLIQTEHLLKTQHGHYQKR